MLLRDMLGEYQQLTECWYLQTASPSHEERIYRIPRRGGLVRVHEHGIPHVVRGQRHSIFAERHRSALA